MKLDESFVAEARDLLDQAGEIIITNHVNPDGDAMGSALGLYNVLKSAGKNVKVIVPNNYTDFLKWLKGTDEVIVFEDDKSGVSNLIATADLIFHLDYNSLKRSGPMEEALSSSPANKIIIDHHQQPKDFADLLYSDPSMSSTCEMVFHFVEKLGLVEHLSLDAANCLYTGLMTDTGNFRFSSTTPTTHKVASRLLELGVKPSEVSSKVYDSNSIGRLKLLSRALSGMEVLEQYGTAIISLTEKDLEECNYKKGDTEGFVNYGLALAGVEFSAFVYPRENKVKMSFRSKTDFDVNAFARAHFDGGGHLNAAGGVSYQSLEKTIEKIKKVLPLYEDSLHTI